MTQVQDGEVRDKTFDPEETRQETAQRLLRRDMLALSRDYGRLIDRLRLHCRFLSKSDQRRLVGQLRRDCDKAVGLTEILSGELPEFTFLPDDEEGSW